MGAAVEGTLHGIPSLAISICARQDFQFAAAAAFAAQLAAWVLKETLPAGVTLNVNIPPHWNQGQGVRLTRRATNIARQLVMENTDPRNRKYYWINEQVDESKVAAESDYAAIRDGSISITPLVFDCTESPPSRSLERWIQSFQSLPVR